MLHWVLRAPGKHSGLYIGTRMGCCNALVRRNIHVFLLDQDEEQEAGEG
jgi:hypothetical protein